MGNEGRGFPLSGPAAWPAVTSMHAMDNAKTDISMHPKIALFDSFTRKVGGTNPKGQTNPKCLNARLTEACAETCLVPH